MKFLRSMWFVAPVALLLGMGVQTFVLLARVDHLGELSDAELAAAALRPPSRINWDFLSPEMEQLRQELLDRTTAVSRREEDLQEYEKRLQAERAEVEKLKREIETVRDELSQRLMEIQAAEQKNLKNLAATYSEMQPDGALAIFMEMDDEMVVKILAFMKPGQVGPILELMAQTKDGEGTLAGRAAALSYKLRLLRQVKPENS